MEQATQATDDQHNVVGILFYFDILFHSASFS